MYDLIAADGAEIVGNRLDKISLVFRNLSR
jgi:hypothetical protein